MFSSLLKLSLFLTFLMDSWILSGKNVHFYLQMGCLRQKLQVRFTLLRRMEKSLAKFTGEVKYLEIPNVCVCVRTELATVAAVLGTNC